MVRNMVQKLAKALFIKPPREEQLMISPLCNHGNLPEGRAYVGDTSGSGARIAVATISGITYLKHQVNHGVRLVPQLSMHSLEMKGEVTLPSKSCATALTCQCHSHSHLRVLAQNVHPTSGNDRLPGLSDRNELRGFDCIESRALATCDMLTHR